MASVNSQSTRGISDLQVADILADLNELQHASDPQAALALLQIPSNITVQKSSSTKSLPARESSFGVAAKRDRPRRSAGVLVNPEPLRSISSYNNEASSSTTTATARPSHAARLRAESSGAVSRIGSASQNRPPIASPNRGLSYTSSSMASISEHLPANTDLDLHRALTLLHLYPKHSTSTPQSTHTTPPTYSPVPSLTHSHQTLSSTSSTSHSSPSNPSLPPSNLGEYQKPPSSASTTSLITNPWDPMHAPPVPPVQQQQQQQQHLSPPSTNNSNEGGSPSSIRRERIDVATIAEHYLRLKETELISDFEGMSSILQDFGVGVEEHYYY